MPQHIETSADGDAPSDCDGLPRARPSTTSLSPPSPRPRRPPRGQVRGSLSTSASGSSSSYRRNRHGRLRSGARRGEKEGQVGLGEGVEGRRNGRSAFEGSCRRSRGRPAVDADRRLLWGRVFDRESLLGTQVDFCGAKEGFERRMQGFLIVDEWCRGKCRRAQPPPDDGSVRERIRATHTAQ